jgi:virginiamycin B lyase
MNALRHRMSFAANHTTTEGDLPMTASRHLRRIVSGAVLAVVALCLMGANSALAAGAPANVTLPTISPTAPHLGLPSSGATGSWSNGPTSLSYQWERCNSAGVECKALSGAASSSYVPVEGDLEHTLRIKVTASNAEGSTSASSAATSLLRPLGHVSEYSIGTASGVTTGPDGSLWVTLAATNELKQMTTGGTVLKTVHLASGASPAGITLGPDGNLWIAQPGTSTVAMVTPAGAIKEYSVPPGAEPWEITTGPDNNLWVTDKGTSTIGKVTTAGTFSQYLLPIGSEPYGIISGPGEDLWFTERGTGKIGKISTSGALTEYSLAEKAFPTGIAEGSDGNVWFGQNQKLAKITSAGIVTTYALPEAGEPGPIVAGPGNDLWFVERGTHRVSRSTTGGVIEEFKVTPTFGVPKEFRSITLASDGNLWFTALKVIASISP